MPVAPLFAQAILNIANGTSVSSLFEAETLEPIYEGMYTSPERSGDVPVLVVPHRPDGEPGGAHAGHAGVAPGAEHEREAVRGQICSALRSARALAPFEMSHMASETWTTGVREEPLGEVDPLGRDSRRPSPSHMGPPSSKSENMTTSPWAMPIR